MPFASVYTIDKEKVAEIELSDVIFGAEVNEALLYEVVKMQMALRRRGTASVKGRQDVSGGGRKPWRQKGTGRARAGTIRSPLWKGGGIVFGPQPRNYSYKISKRTRKVALRSALSMKFKENKMLVLADFPMNEIKTKDFKAVVDRFGFKKVLFVLDRPHPVLERSSRNLKEVKMIRSEGINVYDLLNYEHLVLLKPSVEMIEGALLS